MTYLADPICDDVHATLPLEAHITTFSSSYYSTSQGMILPLLHTFPLLTDSQGRKKLKQVETELNRFSTISHPNLLRVLAVKLTLPHGNSSGTAKLFILSEERPRLSLEDLLEDCESLREDRASVHIPSFVHE